ncbi:type II toxin-antitoxin system VapC family toxin [Novipirellula artificiosorum]|uniref:PIN domain protein n=1 Tax=Novipirellula artificiosorum TaxID=2528016 RepID=A0A5C6DJ59_9BACT|nr:PIN domain-containing protein [Novipirellula artificiosorum]TWU37423.1 PIN domain protein [Novipirellula artificiosorum]
MKVLLDTNLLLRSIETASKQHAAAKDAIKKLAEDNQQLVIVPQVIYEFWSVATRPQEYNGLGLSPKVAKQRVDTFERMFDLLPDSANLYAMWLDLVESQSVIGKNVHDARLVAAMYDHGVSHLLTFNAKDFRRYDGIGLIEPNEE